MAKSVLNKSLKLFEEDIRLSDKERYSKTHNKNSSRGKVSGIQKRRLDSRKNEKHQSTAIFARKKDVSGNKILENLQILEKLHQKEIDRNSSAKVCILKLYFWRF